MGVVRIPRALRQDHARGVNSAPLLYLRRLNFLIEGTDLIALDEALTRLEQFDPRKAKVVSLRYFAGLSIEETAEVLKVSPETVKRDWRLAKVWLLRELTKKVGDDS